MTYLFERSYANLVEEVSKIPRNSIVMLLTVFADSEGNAFVPAHVAGSLSAVSPAPLYAPYDTYIGNGIVGGFVETFESVGVRAADMPMRKRPFIYWRKSHRMSSKFAMPSRRLFMKTIGPARLSTVSAAF